jgi:hypothetical protein
MREKYVGISASRSTVENSMLMWLCVVGRKTVKSQVARSRWSIDN